MKETNTQPNLWQFLKFSFKNYYTFKAMVTKNKISPILTLANIEIGKMDLTDPLRDQRISEFNQAMIEFYKGRWYATQTHNNNSKKEWELAFANFKNANKKVGKLRKALINKSRKTLDFSKSKITTGNTEIKFADGVPLVPEITPIVILNGTDFEMGRQYAKQIVQIFGHPAMNDKGLAYVHHGGGPKFLEPEENWGYGIRRAASVMHILRFAKSTRAFTRSQVRALQALSNYRRC